MSWNDASQWTDFMLRSTRSGEPTGLRTARGADHSGLVSTHQDTTPGYLPGSSQTASYGTPMGEAAWQGNIAPYTAGWSRSMTAALAPELEAQIEAGNALYEDFLIDEGVIADPKAERKARKALKTGTAAGTGGEGWETQNQWNAAYTDASTKTGAPANLIKAVQAKETGKFWQGEDGYPTLCPGDPGSDILNPGMGCIAPNTGIYEETARSYNLDFERIGADPEYAIYAMGVVLNGIATSDASAFGGPEGQSVVDYAGWDGVAGVYFGGRLDQNFVDGNGQDTGGYVADINTYLAELGGVGAPAGGPAAAAPATAPGVTPSGSIGSVSAMWGGYDAPVTQGLGEHTGEQANGDPHIYDYALEYGGFVGHPGIDYGLARDTPIASPISGTVVYTGQAPNGESYYKEGAGGIGEIRLQASNGDIIILGHMATANIKAGDQINVGQLIGTSGQSDSRVESQHLHLEVRVLQPNGGYLIADPNTYFGTAGGGGMTAAEPVPPENIGAPPSENTIGTGEAAPPPEPVLSPTTSAEDSRETGYDRRGRKHAVQPLTLVS